MFMDNRQKGVSILLAGKLRSSVGHYSGATGYTSIFSGFMTYQRKKRRPLGYHAIFSLSSGACDALLQDAPFRYFLFADSPGGSPHFYSSQEYSFAYHQ
jgi:hypothetical protein